MTIHPALQYLLAVAAGFFLARFIVPPFIVLHELGHFVVAKMCRIPVLGFRIGSGKKLFEFRFMNLPWQFNRVVDGGAVEVPRLVPVNSAGWRSVRMLALGGPAMNLSMVILSFLLIVKSSAWLVDALSAAVFFANYHLLKNADQDYAMAKIAKERDMDKLRQYHRTGPDAPDLFEIA